MVCYVVTWQFGMEWCAVTKVQWSKESQRSVGQFTVFTPIPALFLNHCILSRLIPGLVNCGGLTVGCTQILVTFCFRLGIKWAFLFFFLMPLDSVLIRWSQENPAWHLVLTTTIKTLSGCLSDDHVCHCRNETGICPFYYLFNFKCV